MDRHLSLSFELIYLMGWLLKHEKGMLNSLIKQALKNGLAQEMEKVQFDTQGGTSDASQELQTIILDFLAFLERSLAKNLDTNHDAEHHSGEQKMEASDIKMRLQRAKQLLAKEFAAKKDEEPEKSDKASTKKNSNKDSREAVFDQILKTWKPNKSDLVN